MGSDVAAVLDRAVTALADLRALDLDCVGDEVLTETVLSLQRLRGSLEVAEARVLARWEAQGCWRPSGAKTAAAWLAWKERLPIGVARQRVRHARALRTMPAVEQAWGDGEIDRSHVVTLLGARTPRTAQIFDQDHKLLLDVAREGSFNDFKRACDLFTQIVDPDGAEDRAAEDRAAREVHLSQSFEGMWFGRMTLDPISGEIVATTLRMIERELFEADWKAAKQRLGRDPLLMELDRTPAQRRADALVEMATRARTAPANGRRPAPLFTVVVGLETLKGRVLELFNRTIITPGTAAAWLTDAYVERVVFDGPSRVIDVGAQRRFFRGALRRAIEVRDRSCYHPSCDAPPERLQIDHIHEHAKGGPTTQGNGQPACGFHNLLKNKRPRSDPDDDH
jgi:hypothetical protein